MIRYLVLNQNYNVNTAFRSQSIEAIIHEQRDVAEDWIEGAQKSNETD
jgi:hypothetical protein